MEAKRSGSEPEREWEFCSPALRERCSLTCDLKSVEKSDTKVGKDTPERQSRAEARRERREWRSRAPPSTAAELRPRFYIWLTVRDGGSSCVSGCNLSPPHRKRNFAMSDIALLVVVSLLVLTTSIPLAATTALSPSKNLSKQNETGVCQSMDIRNSADKLNRLRNCRVIEGFLQILLIDGHNESSYENLTFPELREITGYLLLYRVTGIKTLAKLFPNLAVIRGLKTFSDYSLVIYDMKDMEEIGLYSLTDISRGSVRIERNYRLCFANTIDWNHITIKDKGSNYIRENKAENECPACPGDDGGHTGIQTLLCPVAPNLSDHVPKRHLCWNENHCQKTCPPGCRSCNEERVCCDENCLGGCTGNKSNCTVCQSYSIGDFSDRRCVEECPNNLYKYHQRRCVTYEECRALDSPKELPEKHKHPYKPINGTCMLECPHGFYEEDDGDYTKCKPCEGPCRKDCHGEKVDSIQAAQNFRGCTYIIGVLEISVRGGGSIIKELEEGLGLITDITGSLKVVRSYPLVSLNFLKSLKKIHGLDLNGNPIKDYVLTVTDNQNLQELWNWEEHGDIEIPNGKLFFHFNPKLCIDKIEPLRRMAPQSPFTDTEVARSSNGDKIACNVTELNVTISEVTSTHIVINWDLYASDDPRILLGYVVYSTEAPNKNITLYDGRDACGGDGWHVDDITVSRNATMGSHLLSHLKPFTQYAIYIKTYTVERAGAQSNIMFIRTLPGEPSPPKVIEVHSPNPNALYIKWLTSETPNGIITKYRVFLELYPDSEATLRQRNFCNSPISLPEDDHDINPKMPAEEKPKPMEPKDKCSCDANVFPQDEEVRNKISFEDYLQNHVFQRKLTSPDMNRKRREIGPINQQHSLFPINPPDTIQPTKEYKTVMKDGYHTSFVTLVENGTSIEVRNLRHYGLYAISVWACREYEEKEFTLAVRPDNCSIASPIVRKRTAKLPNADNVSNVTVKVLPSNSTLKMVRVEWSEPLHPNGYIVTYSIKYKNVDLEYPNAAFKDNTPSFCLTRQNYLSEKFFNIHLTAGNYSIRVMATSLAGNGNYSASNYVLIESPNGGVNVLAIVVPVVVLLLIVIGIAVYFSRRYWQDPLNLPKTLIADVNPEYISNIYVPDEWEVSRSDIELIKELGQGSFGMVYEGKAKNLPKILLPELRCAVKTINEHATERERSDFLKEASVMKGFDTPHVVHLLGVVSTGQPTLVIMELMEHGDLKSYLRSHREQHKPTLSRITQMALEIADGMAYLSAKKFVHRDLAARNCMVSGNLTVKIGDFGMTRDIYETDYYRKGSKGLLPVRWMSPESLKDGVFTSSSDAWSYGIVLWEMATLASQPYQGLSNDQVVRYVIDGGVMERPENCPDNLYQLMQLTWHHRARHRPTFLELVSYLANDATPEFRQNSFFFSTEGQELFQQFQPHPVTREKSNGRSVTSAQLISSWEPTLASQESDSSPLGSNRVPISPISSYRDRIRLVPFSDKSRGEPHELEALVNTYSHSAPPPPGNVKISVSSTMSICPNGYLIHPGNNGNPISLGSSRC